MIRWPVYLYGRFMCAILLHKDTWHRSRPGFREFIRPDTTPLTMLHLLFLDTILSTLTCYCARCGKVLGR